MTEKTVKLVVEVDDRASAKIRQLANETQSQFTKIKTSISRSLSGLSPVMEELVRASGGTFNAFARNASKAFSDFKRYSSQAIDGFKEKLIGMAEHMRWASLFITAAITGIGVSMVNMAGSLEQTRTAFEILFKDDAKIRSALTFIKQWALETPFSVNEATDSFKRFLAITGDVDKSARMMKALGDAIVATGGNVNEFNFAARGMSQIMAMSKVRAQEMYQLVNANIPAFDILAKAIQDGRLKVEGLNTAVSKSTGPTKAMTSAYEKANEQMGVLGKRAEAASVKINELKVAGKENTSAFKSAEASLMSATLALEKAKKSVSDYSVATATATKSVDIHKMSLEEIKGELQNIGMLNIAGAEAAEIFMEYFEKAYGGAAKAQTETLIGQLGVLKDQIVFGSAALLGYNQLTGETYGIYAKIKEALGIINKFLKEQQGAFERIGKVLGGQMGTWALFGILVGAASGFLLGILAPVVQVAIAFGLLGVAIGSFIELYNKNKTVFSLIAGAIAGIGTALVVANIGGIISAIVVAMMPLGAAILAITGPVGLIAIAIGVLAGVIIMNWDKISKALSSFAANAGKWITETWKKILSAVTTFVNSAGVAISNFVKSVGQWFSATWSNVSTTAIAFFVGIGNTISGFVTNSISAIGQFINSAIVWFLQLPTVVGNALYTFFFTTLPYAVSYFIGWMLVQFPALIMNIMEQIGLFITNTTMTFTNFWTVTIPTIIGNFIMWATVAIPTFFNNVFMWIGNFIINATSAFWNFWTVTVPTIVTNFVNWISVAIPTLIANLVAWFTNLWEQVSKIFVDMGTSVMDEVKTWPDRIFDWLKSLPGKVKGILDELHRVWDSALEKIRSLVQTWKERIIGFFDDIIGKIRGAIDAAREAFSLGLYKGSGGGQFQHGGIVPGPTNVPVPIIAHGGERIVSRTGVDTNMRGYGGNININFYGAVQMDSQARVDELAERIKRMLGRQNELVQLGIA